MIKLGNFQVNMGGYTELAQLILSESAKYLFLLLFSVLAVRLWRRLPRLSAENKRNNLLMACLASVIACGIGYFSIYHSLSRLYSYYGTRAFNSGYLSSAYSLFEKSSAYWKSADAIGEQGVCLLWLGDPKRGIQMIAEAKKIRAGHNNSFEQFYEGLYYFFQKQADLAIPLLAAASTDPAYNWNVTKLFAVLYVDNDQFEDAERLMKPFAEVKITDYDHAYIMASLALFEGKKAEAKILVDKFGLEGLPPFWKSRFDTLRAKIQNQTP